MISSFKLFNEAFNQIADHKTLITTINAHCYNISKIDGFYKEVLQQSVIIPDGISIVWAIYLLTGKKIRKKAGADLFQYEMERLQQIGGKCFFLGSTDATLSRIKARLAKEYPQIKVEAYSPPYKQKFTAEENNLMLSAINSFQPNVLMIGMTAPKQEKWAYQHYNELQVGHICCIGAVFDFYGGIVKRAPQWMIKMGLEWLYRLVKEPRRMWHRYLIGNTKFILYLMKEKIMLLRTRNNKQINQR